MNEIGLKNPNASLSNLGFGKTTANWNLSREALIQKTLDLQQGVLPYVLIPVSLLEDPLRISFL